MQEEQEVQIVSVVPGTKGKVNIRFETGVEMALYRGELRGLPHQEGRLLLREEAYIPPELYRKLLYEIVGLRAKKRAMFLLEQMDRTEHQLREKLKKNGYPEECVEEAVLYVKKYHYIDDLRYATHYIKYHQQKKSRQKLKMDLMQKGVKKDIIEIAMEENFDSDEKRQIKELLEKRRYNYADADEKETRRTYQFLMRRGYKSSDILGVLKKAEAFY